MFAVIYRFELLPHQEAIYIDSWNIIVTYLKEHRGALGSSLHKGKDDLWLAYSRWPDKGTRDIAWPIESDEQFGHELNKALTMMQQIREENKLLKQYDEICLEVVSDRL